MEKRVAKTDDNFADREEMKRFLQESLTDVDEGRTRPAIEALDQLATKYKLLSTRSIRERERMNE